MSSMMKVYSLEFDLSIPVSEYSIDSRVEHRVLTFDDISEFMKTTEYWSKRTNVSNLKAYSGIIHEISVQTVLNPF